MHLESLLPFSQVLSVVNRLGPTWLRSWRRLKRLNHFLLSLGWEMAICAIKPLLFSAERHYSKTPCLLQLTHVLNFFMSWTFTFPSSAHQCGSFCRLLYTNSQVLNHLLLNICVVIWHAKVPYDSCWSYVKCFLWNFMLILLLQWQFLVQFVLIWSSCNVNLLLLWDDNSLSNVLVYPVLWPFFVPLVFTLSNCNINLTVTVT